MRRARYSWDRSRRGMAATAVIVAMAASALGAPVAVAAEVAPDFVVTCTGDGADAAADGVCADSGGGCTLRAAITEANAATGADVIGFNLPATTTTIFLLSALPAVTETTVFGGTTQPGFGGLPVVTVSGVFTPDHSTLGDGIPDYRDRTGKKKRLPWHSLCGFCRLPRFLARK